MKMGYAQKKTDFLQTCVANDFEYHWPEAAYISVDANVGLGVRSTLLTKNGDENG